MEVVNKVLDIFRPYNKKAMILGGTILLAHIAYKIVNQIRRTDKYALKVSQINILAYTRGVKEPWALIYFNEGDTAELEALCKLLIFNGINMFIVTSRKNQTLMDQIQSTSVRTEVRLRYDFTLFDSPSEVSRWEEVKEDLDRIDCRLFFVFGDTYKMGWRSFEELERKREETETAISPYYVFPMLLLAFAKTVREGKKGMIHIDGRVEEEADETNNILLDGAGAELLLQGVEYKRVVNLQTYLNL